MADCYHCGGPCDTADVDPRNPRCDACQPIADHVVAMNGCPGAHRARCRCGWGADCPDRGTIEVAIHGHWRQVVAEARADG